MNEHKACETVEISRQSYWYQCQAKEDGEIREALQNLAQQHPRWGFQKDECGSLKTSKWMESQTHLTGLLRNEIEFADQIQETIAKSRKSEFVPTTA